jgi:hypothetical protein
MHDAFLELERQTGSKKGTPLLPSIIHNTYFQRQASHIVRNPMHLNIIHLLYNHLKPTTNHVITTEDPAS